MVETQFRPRRRQAFLQKNIMREVPKKNINYREIKENCPGGRPNYNANEKMKEFEQKLLGRRRAMEVDANDLIYRWGQWG